MEAKLERRISKTKYLAAIAVTALIFIAGFAGGSALASLKLEEYKNSQQNMLFDLMGLDLKGQLVEGSDICTLSLDELWQEKVRMGVEMDALETRLGKNDPEVLRQKELYTLIEIKTLLLLEEMNNKCDLNHTIVLFFYTNQKNDPLGGWQQCEDQGYALTTFGKKHTGTDVFAFDINIDNPALGALKSEYNLSKVPFLVYDGKPYPGFKDENALELIRIANEKYD